MANGASPVTDSAYGDALSRKADTAMYQDEENDRSGRRSDWPKTIQPRGAEALRSIVADDAFDLDIRSEAAARLAEVGG